MQELNIPFALVLVSAACGLLAALSALWRIERLKAHVRQEAAQQEFWYRRYELSAKANKVVGGLYREDWENTTWFLRILRGHVEKLGAFLKHRKYGVPTDLTALVTALDGFAAYSRDIDEVGSIVERLKVSGNFLVFGGLKMVYTNMNDEPYGPEYMFMVVGHTYQDQVPCYQYFTQSQLCDLLTSNAAVFHVAHSEKAA